jgi:hypothetical protein
VLVKRSSALVGVVSLAWAWLAGSTVAAPPSAIAETPVPRKVLVLYDGDEESELASTAAHRLLALPLEHLGLVVEYADVRAPLPALAGRGYVGLVTWFTDDEMADARRYRDFLLAHLRAGGRVAIVGHLGFAADRALCQTLGLQPIEEGGHSPRVTRHDALVGFEAPVPPVLRASPGFQAPRLERHVEVVDSTGALGSPVVTAAWGGMALDPFVLEEGYGKRIRWVLDPFAFLAAALAPPLAPVLDVTTENGARLLTVHVDGDGFANRAATPGGAFAGEVVRAQFLERYPVPTTFSIIEGETSAQGLYPQLAPRLEEIARGIFRLPNVEVASHTFSHPFDWAWAGGAPRRQDPEDEEDEDPKHLPIPGYVYDVKREIAGSVRYIDTRLAPAGKPTRVLLWSGSALPGADALHLAEEQGLFHLNGYNADRPGDRMVLANVPSLGRPVDGVFQYYAPAMNEMEYTNDWRGPFYGYRRAIDFFRFTDAPRRLRSIGIYYHSYSGTNAAAVRALREVYQWALGQEVLPVWISEYVQKVKEFQRAKIFRVAGGFRLEGISHLRTARLPAGRWPDLERSSGVVGVRELPQGRYVSFDGSGRALLLLQAEAPAGPYLTVANGEVLAWRRERGAPGETLVRARLRSPHGPLRAAFGGCQRGVEVRGGGAGARRTGADDRGEWVFGTRDPGEVTLVCK